MKGQADQGLPDSNDRARGKVVQAAIIDDDVFAKIAIPEPAIGGDGFRCKQNLPERRAGHISSNALRAEIYRFRTGQLSVMLMLDEQFFYTHVSPAPIIRFGFCAAVDLLRFIQPVSSAASSAFLAGSGQECGVSRAVVTHPARRRSQPA